jgi:sensor c-di-GMP phosphodiesterase-like protein
VPAFEPAARWNSICATRSQRANSELNYQPLVTLETGVISGFEALLR